MVPAPFCKIAWKLLFIVLMQRAKVNALFAVKTHRKQPLQIGIIYKKFKKERLRQKIVAYINKIGLTCGGDVL